MRGREYIHSRNERRRSKWQQSEEELGVRSSLERHDQVGKVTQQGEKKHTAMACNGGPAAYGGSIYPFTVLCPAGPHTERTSVQCMDVFTAIEEV